MPTMPNKEVACALVTQGKRITLCRDKRPIGTNWQNKVWTLDEINRAYEAEPTLNVGLVLGPDSGIIDIEADDDEQQTVVRELFIGGIPRTPTYHSPRGQHWFFKYSDRLATLGGVYYYNHLGIRVGAGGKGAHSVVPPSAGRTWVISPEQCEFADLPSEVIDKLLASQQRHHQLPVIASCNSAALAAMRGIKMQDKGDGSSRLFACACRCVEHGLSDADAVEAIRTYETDRPFPRVWSDVEIIARLRDAEEKTTRGILARPRIDVTHQDLSQLTRQAWAAIEQGNKGPTIFRYAGAPARIERGDLGEPVIRMLQRDHMRHHLAVWATWYRVRRVEETLIETTVMPPEPVVRNVLATPDMPLPILTRLTEAPVFAASGELQTTPGYCAASQTFFSPAKGFVVPEVPTSPTPAQIASAKGLICDELFGDFPFATSAAKAHAVALLLLPFVRDMIAGPTPLHLVQKPSPGTGATLLVDSIGLVALGRQVPTMTEGRDEEEWRKRITSKLRGGPAFVVLDNLKERLDSPAVASAITSPTWEGRILGASEVVSIPVRCSWIATGNNPALSHELARRTIDIRLDARVDRPWLRDGFRHPDLREWIKANRSELVAAILTLIRAWIAAGRPAGTKTLGMFEQWASVMGGILDVAGIDGFMTGLNEFYDETDAEDASWRGFLAAWWAEHKSTEIKVPDLLPLATESGCSALGTGSVHAQKVRLGSLLAEMRDRVFDLDIANQVVRLKVERTGTKQRAGVWRLAV